jgi:pimeloyl-ACP methyl ester carboxylesterase
VPRLCDWWAFRYVLADPCETAIVFLLVCSLLTGIGKFSSLLAQVVTWLGVVVLFLFCLWCIVLSGARALAFPGYLSLVCRSMEHEVTKRSAANHQQMLGAIADVLVLGENDPEFGLKVRAADGVVREGVLRIMLATLKHMQSMGRLSAAGREYMGPLGALLESLDLLAPTLHSVAGRDGNQAEAVSKRSRLLLLSRVEELREAISLPLGTMTMELGSTLYHEPKEEEGDASDEDEEAGVGSANLSRDDETVTFVDAINESREGNGKDREGGQDVGGGGGGGTGAKRNGTTRKSGRQHWLMSLCKTAFEFLSSWYAARQPLDVVLNIAYLRSEIMVRYAAEEDWVTGVDAVYFPPAPAGAAVGAGGPHADAWAALNGPKEADTARRAAEAVEHAEPPSKIVIMCFPNAGVLEFVHHQSDWLPFYLSRGFGVVLSNYRGYGPTAGKYGRPYPGALKQDATAVLAAVRARFPGAKVMVHGESMGGMVACSLASNALAAGDGTHTQTQGDTSVELAYVDRTFRDLPTVGASLLKFAWIERAMRTLVPWDTDNVRDWLNITCPKVCANDPNDTMIADRSCLKAGVAAQVCAEAVANGDKWAAGLGATLPLWNDAEGTAAASLCGAWNALRSLLSANAVQDPAAIRRVLSLVHFCDGRQNNVLGQAMHDGEQAKESVQRWAQCLLVWGPVSQVPDTADVAQDRMEQTAAALMRNGHEQRAAMIAARRSVEGSTPQPLERVYHAVYEALAKGAAGNQGAMAMKVLAEIIGELKVAYTARSAAIEVMKRGGGSEGGHLTRLGSLLPLRCGHNMPLRADEMKKVKAFLTAEGWL